MKPLRPSNYDIMRDRMELEFAKYDQMEMIRKFSLRYDKDFYIFALLGGIIELTGQTAGQSGILTQKKILSTQVTMKV